jgi:hypothetical protein
MKPKTAIRLVQEIMLDFTSLTGLKPAHAHPQRYLWTDAFAVCNYLELFRQNKNQKYLDLARRLVDQVHHTLGRHRADDPRVGWISGLDQEEGELHPTKGGLRIGKPLKERGPEEPLNERLEWDQDGQYYHYLTKWMHALHVFSTTTKDPTHNQWAIELAKTAHARFTYVPPWGGQKRMYWKMSIDLTYPLVPSMGQHDPLDGFLTYSELQLTAARNAGQAPQPSLDAEIADMVNICQGQSWATDDPLGIGGLLSDASRIGQLIIMGNFPYMGLLETVLDSALLGIESFVENSSLEFPADYRLAFRELGLSIGFKGVKKLLELIKDNPKSFKDESSLKQRVEALREYVPLGESIELFWLDGKNRESSTWTEHREINMVTLATSLTPESFLRI